MTREEFINWFEERFALNKNNIYEFGQLYDEVTKPRWISVEDELPKDDVYVTTINKYGLQEVRYYSRGKWYSNFGDEHGSITHWMPIPQLQGDKE